MAFDWMSSQRIPLAYVICLTTNAEIKSLTFYRPENLIIYGYSGSTIEEYVNKYNQSGEGSTGEYNITFIDIDSVKSMKDENTKIEIYGVISDDTALTAEVIKADEENQSITFDITLIDGNGATVQPESPIVVKIPVPEGWNIEDLKVYRAESDDTYTDMNAFISEGYFIFNTDHFSTYILSTQEPVNDNGSDDSGDDSDDSGNDSGSGSNDDDGGDDHDGTTTTTTTVPESQPETTTTTEATTTSTEATTTTTESTSTTTKAPATTTTEAAATTIPEPAVTESPETTTVPSLSTTTPPPSTTTTAPEAAGNIGADNDEEPNPSTATTLLILPALTAAAAIIISKKRK